MRGAVKEWTLRIVMVLVSTVVALLCAEGLARVFYPISDGRDNVTLSGERITGWFEPGVYRQVSNEYDARTTITDKRHRVPGVDGNPEVIFLGDSFTYGWGLNDDEAFASIYCRELRRACVNLGRPGTGTAAQLDRLEEFIAAYEWKPREVKLFFFGMSTSFSSGNDFVDNYFEGRARRDGVRFLTPEPPAGAKPAPAPSTAPAAAAPPAPERERTAQTPAQSPPAAPPASEPAPRIGLAERIIGLQTTVLGNSNLMRIAKYHAGPLMKSLIVADPGEERMAEALMYTEANLKRFHAISQRVGFDYTIYLIVPVQDIIRHTQSDTLATLNKVSPKPAVDTSPLFVDSPQRFYYSFDGHVNAVGSRRIAEFLISRDRGAVAAR